MALQFHPVIWFGNLVKWNVGISEENQKVKNIQSKNQNCASTNYFELGSL